MDDILAIIVLLLLVKFGSQGITFDHNGQRHHISLIPNGEQKP